MGPVGVDTASWKSWHRWTAICLLAYIYLAVAVAVQRQQDSSSDLDAGLIPITVPELLRLLRDIVIPPPAETRPTGCTGPPGYAAISSAPTKPTSAGMPTPRQHNDHNELQLPYQRTRLPPNRTGKPSEMINDPPERGICPEAA